MLLAVAHHHWWSNYRTALLERVGDELVVHDVGPGFGPEVWVRFPLLADAGVPSIGTGPEPMRFAHAHTDGHVDPVAGVLAGALASVIVGRMREREARVVTERLGEVLRREPNDRLARATARVPIAGVVRSTGKQPGQWVLAVRSPARRYWIAAGPGDEAAVAARVDSLLLP